MKILEGRPTGKPEVGALYLPSMVSQGRLHDGKIVVIVTDGRETDRWWTSGQTELTISEKRNSNKNQRSTQLETSVIERAPPKIPVRLIISITLSVTFSSLPSLGFCVSLPTSLHQGSSGKLSPNILTSTAHHKISLWCISSETSHVYSIHEKAEKQATEIMLYRASFFHRTLVENGCLTQTMNSYLEIFLIKTQVWPTDAIVYAPPGLVIILDNKFQNK